MYGLLALILGSFAWNSALGSAHEGDHSSIEDLNALYKFQLENPEAKYEITDKKSIREEIRWISKIKDDILLKDINHKDLQDTHITTQYAGKIWDRFNVHASVFEFEGMDEGWALIVIYDVDRNKLIDMAKIKYAGENAEVTNYLTGKTVDLDEKVKQNETNSNSIEIMWHAPGEKDLWNDPNCEWAAVVYCGLLGFLVTPWGSIACGASWAGLCH